MASKAQQKAWLALLDDEDTYCPQGHQCKAWLFGGQSIAAMHALFDVAASGLATVADLFGDDVWFADGDAFCTAQHQAIDERRTAYLNAGWSDVVIMPATMHFATWEYEKTPKRKGGRVYVDVRSSGEVIFHEGYVSRAEARRTAKGEITGTREKPARTEVTSTMQTYIDLHRHAAVRAGLTSHPGVALRLMVAHVIVGSHLWRITPEPQTMRNQDVRESVETCLSESAFDQRRRAVLAVLGFSSEEATVTGGNGDDYGLIGVLFRLLDLLDAVVMETITIVMGETLAAGSAAVEAVGLHIGVDMASCWQADDAFFDLIRDKEVLSRIVGDVAGDTIARANATEKAKTLKRIVRDHLDGADGRAKVETWVPRWMAFPPSAYTQRGGVGSVVAFAKVEAARAGLNKLDPDAPPTMVVPDPETEVEIPGAAMPLAA